MSLQAIKLELIANRNDILNYVENVDSNVLSFGQLAESENWINAKADIIYQAANLEIGRVLKWNPNNLTFFGINAAKISTILFKVGLHNINAVRYIREENGINSSLPVPDKLTEFKPPIKNTKTQTYMEFIGGLVSDPVQTVRYANTQNLTIFGIVIIGFIFIFKKLSKKRKK
jgi:hypothetical protein